MTLHLGYLIFISVLFTLVFAVMIHSLIRHRQAACASGSRFPGTAGKRQWLWTLVPMAMLAFVNVALIDADVERAAVPKIVAFAAASASGTRAPEPQRP